MIRKTFYSIALMAFGVASAGSATAQQPMSAQDIEAVRDSYIFVFKDTMERGKVANEVSKIISENRAGASLVMQRHVYNTAIKGFSGRMPAAVAAKIAASNPNIAYYEADRIVHAYQAAGGVNSANQPAQQTPYGITRVNGGTSGVGRTVWVLDTGIDTDHPDLNIDLARSANFITSGPNTVEDGTGHGTHVAGTIAALDNGIGVVGVAPGATVVAIRVLDNRGSGTLSGVIAGVDYVAANAAPGEVANMSLGGGASSALDNAVISAASRGILFALAAGNESTDAATRSPARANHPNIWTVSAIDSNDVFAWFSNFGNPPVDCAAPGVGVLSTHLNGGYATLSGTSMAAPHVAGILLFGSPNFSGSAINDPDGSPDPICVF